MRKFVLESDLVEQIGFIGAGQMAQALAAGITASDANATFLISDPSDMAKQAFLSRVGASRTQIAESNTEVLEKCSPVFLAVKPQYLANALQGIRLTRAAEPLLISVLAGVHSSQITKLTGIERVIRVMPNTPCLIGQGASAMSVASSASTADVAQVRTFLESVGTVVEVPEAMLDSVTGLSGSGPAFVFSFIEALIEGAVLTGMPRDTARLLAIETVIGAATLAKITGEHTSVLRDRVTSPGGTTVAGLKALEEKGFRDSVMSAVRAATLRSRELGKL